MVTNVSSAKQIIHVTVYNAWSRGVVDFDEVLSGYDVWSINWRDVVTGDFQNFDTGSASGGFWSGSTGTGSASVRTDDQHHRHELPEHAPRPDRLRPDYRPADPDDLLRLPVGRTSPPTRGSS